MKKKQPSGDMPQTEQRRYPNPMEELQYTTAIPRDTEFDLEPVQSKTRIGSWGDECTFKVEKRGNRPSVAPGDKS